MATLQNRKAETVSVWKCRDWLLEVWIPNPRVLHGLSVSDKGWFEAYSRFQSDGVVPGCRPVYDRLILQNLYEVTAQRNEGVYVNGYLLGAEVCWA